MFAIPTAPAKQTAGDAITTLSSRLSSATLLEDRRAAILGLRSFAKDYPASVASGALRGLIGSLSKDGDDVDTVKVVLETLISLFEPNRDSDEASEDIARWLADEFTQRQENISLLLDFVDSPDFYSRLYALRLLAAILAARTERAEDCIFTAPLGISRLVASLADRREAVRNEALTLLISLTVASADIQKLVAFENAYERIFTIILEDGSLSEGERSVENCLVLLANLLRSNSSNQTLFRESGCVPRLASLLEGACQSLEGDVEAAGWVKEQVNRNIYALLAVARLLLVQGSIGTTQNQAAFWQHGLVYHALQLGFSRDADMNIKAEALVACADMIRGNAPLQEGFAQLQVSSAPGVTVHSEPSKANGVMKVYVIDGLVDLTLGQSSLQAFDLRLAACECLKAYFHNHAQIRLHFLQRAIQGHKAGADEAANVLTVLLRPSTDASAGDPYRIWFAAVLTFHLLFNDPTAKGMAMAVTEGDASSGEEVVTSIQTITAHLITGLNRDGDPRVVIGYLIMLLGWLFEDLDAVNDFLVEGSNVQSLIQIVRQPRPAVEIVQGLSAMVLGVAYEFSTKDSPIPRPTLHSILLARLGRDRYLDALAKLRTHPFMRDFEVIPQKLDPSTGVLPDVYFDGAFVDFFKDNYSRMARTLDREPGMEISVMANGVQKGISREMVDSLRGQIEAQQRDIQDRDARFASLTQQLDQEQADHKRTKDSHILELARIKSVNEALQRHHDTELGRLRETQLRLEADSKVHSERAKRQYEEDIRKLQAGQKQKEEEHKREVDQSRRRAESEVERMQRRTEAEVADLRATISRLEVDLMKANKSKVQELQALRDEYTAKISEQASLVAQARRQVQMIEDEAKEAKAIAERAAIATAAAEDGRRGAQTELDDLFIVFGDLEEKVARYKARLEALGETISDTEDDGDGGDEDDVD